MNVTDAYYPTKPVVPYIQAIQDRVVLEILRGCIEGAVSVRAVQFIVRQEKEMLKN